MPPPASRIQHAIRLLALMRWAGGLAGVPQNGALAVRSALRQALNSWLRNPDYVADEPLTEVEAGRREASHVDVSSALFDDPELCLRRHPMPRWLFGAYEPLDDAFAHLEEIITNLRERITEATKQSWLVEVEGLQISLTSAEHKLRQMTQMPERSSEPVTLGLPRLRHTDLAEALR